MIDCIWYSWYNIEKKTSKGDLKMAKQTLAQIYKQHVLTEKLELSYGVDYSTFEALKTCGLTRADGVHIKGEVIDAYLSTWFLQDGDLDNLLKDPSEEEYTSEKTSLQNKICNNLVLLGLNAGSMEKATPPWHFFHYRYEKGSDELTQTRSEDYLKEYITKFALPFEGAYMTDILKVQDESNALYIEPNSDKVNSNGMTTAVKHHNFNILKNELDLLHSNMPDDSKMLIVPLGSKCESCLKSFIKWLPANEYNWIAVPDDFMAHYSQSGWNSKRSKNKAARMKSWCKPHIIARD